MGGSWWYHCHLQRQRVEYNEDSDSDADTELPQVVVLKPGDLTAEEAEKEKQKLLKGEMKAFYGFVMRYY